MKTLFLSCHAILEYDELKILEELGVDYFSLGSYIIPQKPVDPIRPPLKKEVDEELLRTAPYRESIPKSFVDNFDTIIVMHVPEWIEANWEVFKGKRVIWRTIGQSHEKIEARMYKYRLEGLEVVRYSGREANIKGNIGSDAVIPFYKDENEFNGYLGTSKEIITIAQNMKHRAEYCNYDAFVSLAEQMPVRLYGTSNEASGPLWGGFLSYNDMKMKLRDARAYIYTGTQPACYTLSFIEAMMTGIPVIALGPTHCNSLDIAGDMYEVPDIIKNAVNGFVSDDMDYLRRVMRELLGDQRTAQRIGEMGRQTAIKWFGKTTVKEKWRKYLQIT